MYIPVTIIIVAFILFSGIPAAIIGVVVDTLFTSFINHKLKEQAQLEKVQADLCKNIATFRK